MIELFNNLRENFDNWMMLATLLGVIIALAAAAYLVKTVAGLFSPLAASLRWLSGVRGDQPPSELAVGVAMGLRMLVWAGILAGLLVAWLGRGEIASWFDGKPNAAMAGEIIDER